MRSALFLRVNGLSCESSLTYMSTSTQDCRHMPPFICAEGKDHYPRTSQRRKQIKEWFFSAAMQGCRPCVQHCIDVLGLDVNIHSDNKKYTVKDWAQWAVDKHVEGAQDVVSYLNSECHTVLPTTDPLVSSPAEMCVVCISCQAPQPPLPSADDVPFVIVPYYSQDTFGTPPLPFEGGRHLCMKHKPKGKSRQDDPKYWLFNAVKDSCKVCVGLCVTRYGIDKNSVSDNNQNTAEDFARYFEDEEILDFLNMLDD